MNFQNRGSKIFIRKNDKSRLWKHLIYILVTLYLSVMRRIGIIAIFITIMIISGIGKGGDVCCRWVTPPSYAYNKIVKNITFYYEIASDYNKLLIFKISI